MGHQVTLPRRFVATIGLKEVDNASCVYRISDAFSFNHQL